jgi:hypothetical protein
VLEASNVQLSTFNLKLIMDEKEQTRQRLRIFLTFSSLLAALAALNLYIYLTLHIRLSLVVMAICGVAFVGWCVFYALYVRRSK